MLRTSTKTNRGTEPLRHMFQTEGERDVIPEEVDHNSKSCARKEEPRYDPHDLDAAVKGFIAENKDNFLKYLDERGRHQQDDERNDEDEDSLTSPSPKHRRRSPSPQKPHSRKAKSPAPRDEPKTYRARDDRNKVSPRRDRRRHRSRSDDELDGRLEGFDRYGRIITPFTNKILNTPLPDKYKVPSIAPYDGLHGTQNFLSQFQYSMINQRLGHVHMCKVFSELLVDNARRWFDSLPPGSIGSYKELMTAFHRRFFQKTASKVTSAHLLTMRQTRGEYILDFMNRFNKECLRVEDISDLLIISAF